jgi:NhaP-type Na+/H+ or K+/H+ antiporter|tara:strand:+ start:5157 stop:5366 length:210 start_codon:yes stop_codon:yes gene_type:complete
MNLLLRPLENANNPVWSVIIMVIIAVGMALGYVIYILRQAFAELKDGSNDTTEQEVLLQLPSDGDQSCS